MPAAQESELALAAPRWHRCCRIPGIDGPPPFHHDYLPDQPRVPRAQLPGVESFFYWSKEQYGAGKRVVAVTHVEIVKPAREHPQEVIVLGKEIFATHYRNASLGTTAIVREPVGNARYLVYINRSHVDVQGGLFGGLKRKLIEGRLKAETAGIIRHVRDRMSGSAPPTGGS